MRILHLLASPAWSGPAENVAYLAVAQRALGHQVSVAVDRKRQAPTSEEPALPRLRELGLLDEGGLELSVKSSPWAMLGDLRALSRRAVEVLHAHFSHDHWVARLAAPPGARLVRSIHAPRSLRRLMPRADAFTVPTRADAEAMARRGAVAAVLPALIGPAFRPAPDRAALRCKLGLEGEPLVGMVSTFQPSRRHALGLTAFARLVRERPQARLVLAGDGALEAELRAQARGLGIEGRVVFAGYQQAEAFVGCLQALDELWVLGLGNDHSGRVAAQARACAVRVLAVAEGGLPDLADVLIERLLPQAVVDASLTGRRTARELPSNEQTAQAVLALYACSGAGDTRR